MRSNLDSVRGKIREAALRAGRSDEIKLVAVSKTHPASTMREAQAAGLAVFGENKVQEAEGKIAEIGRENIEWHLIGHLQSNKARKAVELFDVIQSLDSLDLATRLERICIEEDRPAISVYAQIDLAGESAKSGIQEKDLPALTSYLRVCRRVKFDGLMVLPPLFDDAEKARPFFRRLREIRDELKSQGFFQNGTGELSMGMSHDFEIAIEEGATVVRVGSAIFGARGRTEEMRSEK
ncbi:MAG: YggS family pyridoxal phosphate-dependent enzyme [Acidobacteria bacterium]|nr:MAG: YggS family pyridoxal phosphate-dependent enzyme [Acidobacteriota bacterium]